ncbi:nicotinate (nicotinamide) nucleotide adenylyltransferase [Lentisphaerota bacterium ZTH]|nr:nicotinate (nicotinamide) nucleotide adenylyltransferase [Lentisphaerota bacterium]WET05159.1 nicotinate (nicotinamide) nucleotide adenylyltransferase [Lentisphaerota bacterium ZTH]
MRTAFFGGTFDPPHLGHLKLAEHILASGITERIMFVPAFSPPHKRGKRISSFEDRLQMLKLLLKDNENIIISDIERRAQLSPSYTVSILKLIEQENPGINLQILIGGDSLAYFHTWHKAEELMKNWEIITYPRRDCDPARDDLLQHWNPKEADILLQSKLQMPYFEISSTSLRDLIQNGEYPEAWLPDDVLKYIKKRGLYR